MQRCGLGTGDDAFKAALEAAGGGDKPYVSGAAGILLPNNRVVCCANRNAAGQTNVMVILHERQSDGQVSQLPDQGPLGQEDPRRPQRVVPR